MAKKKKPVDIVIVQKKCGSCGGTGKIKNHFPIGNEPKVSKCTFCGGKGKYNELVR
jgi:DnaJ-class molecular chaperone